MIPPPSSRPREHGWRSWSGKTWSAPTAPAPTRLLKEAAAKYNIPWVRHDFPLPFHAWSMQAAINARWFDTKSKKLGDDYRDNVFANQNSITSLEILAQFTQKYAQEHGVAFPFAPDPQGTADCAESRLTTLSASGWASNTPLPSGW